MNSLFYSKYVHLKISSLKLIIEYIINRRQIIYREATKTITQKKLLRGNVLKYRINQDNAKLMLYLMMRISFFKIRLLNYTCMCNMQIKYQNN